MVKRVYPKKDTKDTFQNFAAKVGMGTNNISSYGTYGFNPVSRNRLLLEWCYRGSWICGVGVDAIADDMTSEGITINSTLKPKVIEKLQSAWQRKQVWQSLNQTMKWGRLYGGALGYIAIEHQDPSKPLKLDTIKPGQFQGITVLDRWMVNPDLTRSIIQPGPDFGLPEFYDVVATSFQFPFPRERIHYSRLVRVEGVELPWNQKVAENMWGISVLERLWDRLLAYDSTTQGAAQLVYKAFLRTIKVEGLRQLIATGGKAYEALVKQIENIRQFQANEGITLLDAKDEFETSSYTFAGLDDILEKFGDQVAGALETPQTRLFGHDASGLNNNGESGMQNYENKIKRSQERWFRRPCDVILRVVAADEGIELPEGFNYDFNSIRQLSDLQKSEVNSNDMSSFASAASIPGMKSAPILKEMRARSRVTGYWSNITDKDIKDAEEVDDAMPLPGEMPLGGGPGGPGQEEGKGGLPNGQAGKAAAQAPKKAPYAPGKKEVEDVRTVYDVADIPVYIETPKGALRQGKDWSAVMAADYGYIEGVGSAEGPHEQLDCFVGPHLGSGQVFVINQNAADGYFDEHKCMLGFNSLEEAVATYKASFHDGQGNIRSVASLDMQTFKQLISNADFKKPL